MDTNRQMMMPGFEGKTVDEDPYKYVESIEVLTGVQSDEETTEQLKRVYFGQGLDGPAKIWYRDLKRETRQDWKALKETFTDHFDPEKRGPSLEESHRVTSQLLLLRQGAEQSIVDYVAQAAELHRACPTTLRNELGARFMACLQDENLAFRAQSKLLDEDNFIFEQAKEAVIRASRPIGRPSPFDRVEQEAVKQAEITQTKLNIKIMEVLTKLADHATGRAPSLAPAPLYQATVPAYQAQ